MRGQQREMIAEAAEQAGMSPQSIERFKDAATAAENWARRLREGDLVLLKASRAVHLELVAQAIIEAPASESTTKGRFIAKQHGR